MINHGTVRAMEKPEAITIDEKSVWVADNIVSVTVTDDSGTRTEWQFGLKQYDKDEYIHIMIDNNATLESNLDDTMLALCEIYEMLDPSNDEEGDE